MTDHHWQNHVNLFFSQEIVSFFQDYSLVEQDEKYFFLRSFDWTNIDFMIQIFSLSCCGGVCLDHCRLLNDHLARFFFDFNDHVNNANITIKHSANELAMWILNQYKRFHLVFQRYSHRIRCFGNGYFLSLSRIGRHLHESDEVKTLPFFISVGSKICKDYLTTD